MAPSGKRRTACPLKAYSTARALYASAEIFRASPFEQWPAGLWPFACPLPKNGVRLRHRSLRSASRNWEAICIQITSAKTNGPSLHSHFLRSHLEIQIPCPRAMQCHHCPETLADTAKLCGRCGHEVKAASVASTPVPAPMPAAVPRPHVVPDRTGAHAGSLKSLASVAGAGKSGRLWKSAAVAALLLVVFTGWLMSRGASPLRPAQTPALVPPPLPSLAAPQNLAPPASTADRPPPVADGPGPAFVPQSMPASRP